MFVLVVQCCENQGLSHRCKSFLFSFSFCSHRPDQQNTAIVEAENRKLETEDAKEPGPVDFHEYRPLHVTLGIFVPLPHCREAGV